MATINFVVSGNRIATESFAIGKIYEIIFTNGNSLICACNHVGNNFVVFQRELPELLFTLNMETASSVRSIEETGGGGGTYNYNKLDNKPQINSVELLGNKSSSDLGLQSALDASQLDAVNSGITAAKVTAFEGKQDAITSNNKLSADLVDDAATANKFVTATEKAAWNAKQNALTTSQLDAVNSGITAAKVTSFEAKQDAITSTNKLSADLVSDKSTTNKFVTAADKTAWNAKQNALTASQLDAVNSGITAAKVTVFEGKQDAITSNSKLSADLVNDVATTNKFVTAAEKAAWNAKQNALTASQLDAVNSGITAAKVTSFEAKQDAITSTNKLSADLVSDKSTTNKFVTAADKTAWNAKQNAIDSSHKLSADLVDDTSTTNKFATTAELEQIETNKNNILLNTQNGVKNLLNLTKVSKTIAAVVFTVNSDKTVTVNGTASPSNSIFNLDDWTCTKAGTYVVSGAPSGGSWTPSPNTYRIRIAVNGAWKGDDVGNGFALALAVGDVINLQINTSTSYTANNLVFKPMITLKSLYDADPTYQSYAMSNAELTAAIQALQAQLANQ